MYLEFFGFNRYPFSRDISTDSIYLTDSHQELLARLQYVADNRLFLVITGDVGTGKTTIIRKFVTDLDRRRFRPVYISDSALTPRVFYSEVLKDLVGLDKLYFYRADGKRKMFNIMSVMLEEGNQIPIIIIDEAHLLSHEMLEETRFLLNYNMDSKNPMALIIAGQAELRTTLSKSIYEPICQRIDQRFKLSPFDQYQMFEYITRQIQYAGVTEGRIFSESAIRRIYDYSQGVARKTNKVCDLTLLHAFQNRKKTIEEPMVSYVIDQELTW